MVKTTQIPVNPENGYEYENTIRQPYRITMAVWECSIYQKRILTSIMSCLQKEIACVDNGLPVEKLPLFATCGGHIIMKLSLRQLVREGNNHHMIQRAFEEFREKNIPITQPAIKGKKAILYINKGSL